MMNLIEKYDEMMRLFCEEYESLEERLVSTQEKLDRETTAIAYIKEDISNLVGEVDEEARKVVEEGDSYSPPKGPPAMVKLSYALQAMYTHKVSHKLLETEMEQLNAIMEATHRRAEESKMGV